MNSFHILLIGILFLTQANLGASYDGMKESNWDQNITMDAKGPSLPLHWNKANEDVFRAFNCSIRDDKTFFLMKDKSPWFVNSLTQIFDGDLLIPKFETLLSSKEWIGLFSMDVINLSTGEEFSITGNPYGFDVFSSEWRLPEESRLAFTTPQGWTTRGVTYTNIVTGLSFFEPAREDGIYNALGLKKGESMLLLDKLMTDEGWHAVKLPNPGQETAFVTTKTMWRTGIILTLNSSMVHGNQLFSILDLYGTLIPKLMIHPYFLKMGRANERW